MRALLAWGGLALLLGPPGPARERARAPFAHRRAERRAPRAAAANHSLARAEHVEHVHLRGLHRSRRGEPSTYWARTEQAWRQAEATGSVPAASSSVITCKDGRVLHVPKSMVLVRGKALWCPNAKVATTSTIEFLVKSLQLPPRPVDEYRCYGSCRPSVAPDFVSAWQLPQKDWWKVCNAYSFTFVRNPWDRLRSAYMDKLVEATTANGRASARVEQMDFRDQSFPTFLEYVERHPEADVHWLSYEERCLTSGPHAFPYSYVGKLEDNFDAELARVAVESGLVGPRALPPVPHRYDTAYDSKVDERVRAYSAHGAVDREAVQLVGRLYAADIARFGYKFQA